MHKQILRVNKLNVLEILCKKWKKRQKSKCDNCTKVQKLIQQRRLDFFILNRHPSQKII